MESILALSVTQNVSDVHLSSGERVIIRQNGELRQLDNAIWPDDILKDKLYAILSNTQLADLERDKQLDFAYSHHIYGRFRINIFYQLRGIAACLRIIRQKPLSLEAILAPEVLKILLQKNKD